MRNVKGGRSDQEPVDMKREIKKKERYKDEVDEKGKKDLQTDSHRDSERELN